MISKKDKNQDRVIRHARVRKKISGTAERPRLCVYRSTNHIYAQVIDDVAGHTLCSASTLGKDVAAQIANATKTDAAKIVGAAVAKKAIELGIKNVVFDRGGYLYTGRVQALADGAREAGLEF
ncbi:MAG: 50S ribosomal protein L18 [Bacteroides sp.]|nr:50S ribosomal protein L18 [Bacillota bacterium]MCM1393978.1 50S ribosomal protein L18 [[Eubacterium] siraeum]MCM1455692.1 50S ribosomal protein L18 [Bacteroides sp.]